MAVRSAAELAQLLHGDGLIQLRQGLAHPLYRRGWGIGSGVEDRSNTVRANAEPD